MITPKNKDYAATQNACNLCTPLGAALAFKGVEGAIPLLHGSQGCSTYIRRYLISHFKEPIDIACSNFAEETAVFGGGANLKTALENIRHQYAPRLIGVATTCLSETIGDDVPMFIKQYREMNMTSALPHLVHVSTPSYQGTHMEGFHAAILSMVETMASGEAVAGGHVNLFPGMLSPADLRYLKEIFTDFELPFMMLPDYSKTLDGALWTEYERIPKGGTPIEAIEKANNARASFEFGATLAKAKASAAQWLTERFDIPAFRMGLPMGVHQTDRFFKMLEKISGRPTPEKYLEERGRLIDCYADSHKHVMAAKAVVYGEEDLVLGMATFLDEIGVTLILCASGGRSGHLGACLSEIIAEDKRGAIQVMDNADYVDIESAARQLEPDIFIGSSKGYAMARRMGRSIVRAGFPIHDRIDGARMLHIGYRGAQQLFDRIANTLIADRQADSTVGYAYM